jgi:predicted dehydrogenase
MDGVMFMHSRRLQAMRAALDNPKLLGPIRRITSAFTFRAPPEFYRDNIRANPALEPQGCLGDLGWYCIRFTLWAMNWRMPQQVTARILAQTKRPAQAKAVLTELSAELFYPGGVSAGFFCSFLAQNQEWAFVSGSRGYLRIEDFVMPFAGRRLGFEVCQAQYVKSGCEFKMEPRVRWANIPEHSQAHSSSQESNLFRAFAHQVRSGRLNPDWPDWALKTQTVMDACLESAEKSVSIRVHPW